MRVGVPTGGGDCPGLNAVIRAVGRRVMDRGHELVGVHEGWKGLVEGKFEPLGRREISGLLPRGGTIIGTTRTNPFKLDGGVERVLAHFRDAELDALVAIGGEDTLGVAARLYEEHEFPVVGVPKTIDNDLSATDYTFGFDTAVWIATEAIDRLHTTAESHNRVMVVEVMGRHTGWIAVMSGIAGGADVIFIPEHPISIEEAVDDIRRRHERGKDFSIVVVSEGYELDGAAGDGRAEDRAAALVRRREGILRLMSIAETTRFGLPNMTAPLRRVVLRAPQEADLRFWREYGWRAEPDAAAIAREHEALCELLSGAGAEVVLAESFLDGAPDAIYT